MLESILSWLSIGAGAVSAFLWMGSTVVKVDHAKYEAALKAKGETWMPAAIIETDGSNVTETMKLQSKWNRWAAGTTALAMACQVVAKLITVTSV